MAAIGSGTERYSHSEMEDSTRVEVSAFKTIRDALAALIGYPVSLTAILARRLGG